MARLWDLRTLRRAAFSSFFKSLAIMTGNLSSPSKNAYSRCLAGGAGSSLSSTSGRFINEEFQRSLSHRCLSSFTNSRQIWFLIWEGGGGYCSKKFLSRSTDVPFRIMISLDQLQMKLDHLPSARNELLIQIKENHCLRRMLDWRKKPVENYRLQNMEWDLPLASSLKILGPLEEYSSQALYHDVDFEFYRHMVVISCVS
ncbi:hypothetical protein Tco_0838859 [Tanacetum coccineum]|uniref:Uncharacterized protein n=1 Tax=Tanacetum coccineum TaxID=301880 RepID=A0ABQ4WUA0_9ASTR